MKLSIKLLKLTQLSLFATLLWCITSVFAGEADVLNVVIQKTSDGKFRIDTTVEHDDTGWDHYADRWDVIGPDGAVLGSRILHHPHVGEQPFTRSLTLSIPSHITSVIIRANDSVHELGGAEMEVEVPH